MDPDFEHSVIIKELAHNTQVGLHRYLRDLMNKSDSTEAHDVLFVTLILTTHHPYEFRFYYQW